MTRPLLEVAGQNSAKIRAAIIEQILPKAMSLASEHLHALLLPIQKEERKVRLTTVQSLPSFGCS